MKKKDKPATEQLSRQFGAGQLIAAVAALLIAGCILIVYQFLSLRQALTEEVEVQAAIVADNISAPLMFRDREVAAEMLRAFRTAPFLMSVTVYDLRGMSFADYHTRDSAPGADLSSRIDRSRFGYVLVRRPVTYRGTELGEVVLVTSTARIRVGMLRYIALLVTASIGSLLVVGLVVRKSKARMVKAERELDYFAHTDPVTELPNRRASYKSLETAIERRCDTSRVALLLIDLDNFKTVNDTAGHGAGDDLLRQVAGVLRSVVRGSDFVGRIGGDEFVVIAAPVVDRAGAEAVARKITEALRVPFQVDGLEVFATASVGVCVYPDDADSMSELVSKADMALYNAKDLGRNRYSGFHPDMTTLTQRRAQLERDLRKSMEQGGLQVYYQPQYDCASETIVGVEALLRWPHPEHGMVPPAEFIPIAEESGLIVELGRWVLERACEDAVGWTLRTGLELSVAVNVSARQLREKDFIHVIERTLRNTGMAPGRLELELTESLLMEDMKSAVAFMHAAREIGVRISIDDFGTGYSSLSYLQTFPLNQLKIDRSFVQLLPSAGFTIASAVISLAHGFKLSVVAEGVENKEQLAWLQEAGCDYVQGYLLGRPMPSAQLLALLHQTTAVLPG
jgi:diguanylate cyclase (GGDEF)-like protein